MKKLLKRTITMLLALTMVFTMVMPVMAAEAEDNAAATAVLTSEQVKAITPSNVKAASYSYSRIKVSWDKLDGVDGYEVYRATSKNGKYEKTYFTGNPDKLYYINTGRTTGKTYWYKIRGYKVISGKTYYTRYSAVTSTYARPDKVKGLTGYGDTHSLVNITLEWQPVSGAAGYEQQVNIKKDGKWSGWSNRCYNYKGDAKVGDDKFSTWDSIYEITKKQFPNGYEEVALGNGKFKKMNWEEATSYAIGKTEAWLRIMQDDSVYKFRVRAYRKVKGKKVYGPWSDEFTLKETLDIDEIREELKAYTIKYAAKHAPDFEYEEDTEGRTPNNSNFSVSGPLGSSSIYARQEDVIADYKKDIRYYIDNCLGRMGTAYHGFLYAERLEPWTMWGKDNIYMFNESSEPRYVFYMLS